MRFRYLHDSMDADGQIHVFVIVRSAPEDRITQEVKDWVRSEFGPPSIKKRAFIGITHVWIRDEADATLFRLRWC